MAEVSYSYQRTVLLAAHQSKVIQSNNLAWREQFERQNSRVSLTEQDELWAKIERSPYAHQFLPTLTEVIDPLKLDVLGYAAASCSTLGEAISLFQRYYALIGDGGDLFVMHTGSLLALEYVPRYQVTRQLRIEAVLVCIMELSKQLTGDRVSDMVVGLPNKPSASFTTLMKKYTKQPLVQCTTPCIRFPKQSLTLPVVTANKRLLPMLTNDLEQQHRALQGVSLEQKLSNWLVEEPELSRVQVATRLRCSERSLIRNLKQEGASFKQIRNLARQQVARKLIQTALPLDEIAHKLGYSDASAFIKAYKRWFGETPRKRG
ncbi:MULTISPECIES: AraC family transcriptional regulator [Gammaproteobacteria]|uniref:AraC family transcriptional regulator n=1 Tax=Gammaproteobacteria TaxID=1236 RepID=UPI000DD03A80|nr:MULTISPECIES: AraC family transcriptional regulator [Gammaproteobacteria]RTE85942.1 AraC family transcriptional regulator [Aliidiomarina sp. B3213]TCZ90059.1 AraC family transcriptional regulator [Lysobacter sp. N42]